MTEAKIPYYTDDAEGIVRAVANRHLQELRMYSDENTAVFEYNGKELTAEMIDRAITQHFEDN
jgi:hypothetical protein